MTAENLQRLKYTIGDIIAASAGWLTYSMIRYHLTKDSAMMAYYDSPYAFLTTPNVVLGQIFFPLVFIFIAYLSGYYNIAYVKSRIQEFSATTFSTFIASMTMFFVILINDSFPERMKNYELIAAMWGCLFFFIYTIRFLLTSKAKARIESGKLYFNTLIIGNNETTDNFLSNLNTKHKELGYKPIGIVRMPGESQKVNHSIPLYEESEIGTICSNNDINTIIIINEKNDKGHIYNLINDLFKYNIPIKITPELHDILTARIRHSNIFGEPLIDIAQNSMPEWQKCVKRFADIFFSLVSLAILSPVFLVIGILIKKDTAGKIFYSQERIGKHGKPFRIYKFRTMVENAEKGNTPMLSSNDDPRITSVGKILRKYRLDETPQFWNVLKGDMSIVGPRPERKFYVDQILKSAPYYTLIYQIRPGISSLGMVKFGYATNVEEMIKRAQYDLIYIENMSIAVDLKIMALTIKTVITGKGL